MWKFNPYHDVSGRFAKVPGASRQQLPVVDDVTAALEDAGRKWGESLDEDQQHVVADYAAEGYASMNYTLREGSAPDRVTRQDVKVLDAVLAKAEKAKAPHLVHRGISTATTARLKAALAEGTGFVRDDAYGSTSMSLTVAQGFANRKTAGGHVVDISIPKGTKLAYVGSSGLTRFPEEEEILLPRGAVYRAEQVHGHWRMTLVGFDPQPLPEVYRTT